MHLIFADIPCKGVGMTLGRGRGIMGNELLNLKKESQTENKRKAESFRGASFESLLKC